MRDSARCSIIKYQPDTSPTDMYQQNESRYLFWKMVEYRLSSSQRSYARTWCFVIHTVVKYHWLTNPWQLYESLLSFFNTRIGVSPKIKIISILYSIQILGTSSKLSIVSISCVNKAEEGRQCFGTPPVWHAFQTLWSDAKSTALHPYLHIIFTVTMMTNIWMLNRT